jgi:hypothetical protein
MQNLKSGHMLFDHPELDGPAYIKNLYMIGDDGEFHKITVTSDELNALASPLSRSKLAGGFTKVTIADGTASGTDVTVTGMAEGDELVSVLALTTKAAITSLADRTSEYAIGTGKLVKEAGTNETDNQLIIIWNDLT